MTILFIFTAIIFIIQITTFLLPGKLANVFELVAVIISAAFLFYYVTIMEAVIAISMLASFYLGVGEILSKENFKVRRKLLLELEGSSVKEIILRQQSNRWMLDLLLTGIFAALFITILLFAGDYVGPAKLLVFFALIYLLGSAVKRTYAYFTVRIYFDETKQVLYVITRLEGKKYALADLTEFRTETGPDILKLFPLFQFFSDRGDYTTAQVQTFKLTFPNQMIYFNPVEVSKWQEVFYEFHKTTLGEGPVKVLPFWHPKVMKRLFIKFYYTITIQGIAAYTAVIIIFSYFGLPALFIISFIIIWWLINLYFSDVLILKTVDAEAITDVSVLASLEQLLKRAGLKTVGLYVTDSTVYNGFATGMNISRGKIILTKATLELPEEAIAGILAHEIIHLKKRDILWQQIFKTAVLAILGLLIYMYYEQIQLLAEQVWPIFVIVYVMMLLIPLINALLSQ